MYGQHDGPRDALARYFEVLASGVHPDDAFQTAFRHDYEGMGETLGKYIRTGQYGMRVRPDSPAARITATPVAAPAAVVEIALARLALAANRIDVAQPHAQRAVAFAPSEPGGHEMLAQVHERRGDKVAALAACVQAERSGSHDASTLFLLAYLSASSDSLDHTRARAIATLYHRVIAVSPTMEEAYVNLAAMAPALEPTEDEDLVALKQGARMFPRRGSLLLGLAVMVDRRGDRATARALLTEARKRGLPINDAHNALRMENAWLFDEASAHIDRLVAKKDYFAALAACDQAIAQVSDIYVKGALVRLRQDLGSRAALVAAEKASSAGDYAGARHCYETMLTEPGLPGSLRRHIEAALRQLPVTPPPRAITIEP
jgi:Flp pilus assembly protein TadD